MAHLLDTVLRQVVRQKMLESMRLQAEFSAKEERLVTQHQNIVDAIERVLGVIRRSKSRTSRRRSPSSEDDEEFYGFGSNHRRVVDWLDLPADSSSHKKFSFMGRCQQDSGDERMMSELDEANGQVRRMLDSLFVELEHCQRENEDLRCRIGRLHQEIGHLQSGTTVQHQLMYDEQNFYC